VPGPWDSYLIQRGVKTLAIRMDATAPTRTPVADFLHAHDLVATTYYPGLVTHPGHAVAERQMRGFGGIVSFSIAGGEAAALAMVERTEVFTLAESLGAVESLIEHPGRMTHAVLAQVAAGRGSGPRSLVGRHREHRRSAGGSRSSFAGLMWASSPQLGRLTSTRSVPPGSGHCLSRRAQVGDRSWSGEPRRLLSGEGLPGQRPPAGWRVTLALVGGKRSVATPTLYPSRTP